MTFLFCLLSASVATASSLSGSEWEPYFCDTDGTKLVYERRYADSGELKWRHTMTIGSVSMEDDGVRTVCYSSDFKKPDGKQLYGGRIPLTATISPCGDVSLDAAESVCSVFRNIFPDGIVGSEQVISTLPSGLSEGDTLPDVSFEVKLAFASFKVDISSRTVLREETINTPAGDFDCLVVQEHREEHGLGRNRITTALTWYARGIGMVRHDTYDKNLRIETSERLISIDNKNR